MPAVRPSAMRSLFVEAPPVRYADIGGQANVIQKLRETVEWPLRHPGAFSRLGVRPPKGVLLIRSARVQQDGARARVRKRERREFRRSEGPGGALSSIAYSRCAYIIGSSS